MKIVGKCAYCKDPIYDSQAKVDVGKARLHKGCLHILREETPFLRRTIMNRTTHIAFLMVWQFICDSAYDLFHLWVRFGQKTLGGWWQVRLAEWFGYKEYNRRWGNED